MEGFYRVAAAVPQLRVADVAHNVAATRELFGAAAAEEAALVVFPELGLCGYTCADLFFQDALLSRVRVGLEELRRETEDRQTILIAGAPLRHRNHLYDCAVVMQNGDYLGIVPKQILPNYKEFYEKRWFSSGADAEADEIRLNGADVPFGVDLLFEYDSRFCVGVEICEDLWNVIPPSSYQALAGATVLVNLSASNELVAKADYRRELVRSQSARCVAGYIYASSGVGESSTDLVFGGHAMIAENGVMLAENERFARDASIIYADLDCLRLTMTRITETSVPSNPPDEMDCVPLDTLPAVTELRRSIDPHPFVPGDPATRDARCHEIFCIQAAGLAKRLEHTQAKCAVVGVSGGLDSTLALLVAQRAMRLLGRDGSAVTAVTMPGFGTSGRTYANAVALCRQIGADLHEIDIKPACEQHFADIGHDPDLQNVTYENVQARERTQLLMDLANKHGGLVIGTGDLSEMALGWSTYNGDHMSMYAVNCSVPKTLVRYVIRWVADHEESLQETLEDILDTPITPELLPPAAGEISQKTESVVGPYELHDFFLYHTIKYGSPPSRTRQLAELAFAGAYDAETIAGWLDVFVQRFFAQQFKRSCVPDGPKVGTISLSPRGDWRMPSDAVGSVWLDETAD